MIKSKSTPKRLPGEGFESRSRSFASSTYSAASEVDWFSHKTIAPYRSEELPVNPKTYGTLTQEVVFKKNKSVFKDWKENTEKILI